MNMPLKTVEEFCRDNRISRTHLWQLFKEGKGPKRVMIGKREFRITVDAEHEWRQFLQVSK